MLFCTVQAAPREPQARVQRERRQHSSCAPFLPCLIMLPYIDIYQGRFNIVDAQLGEERRETRAEEFECFDGVQRLPSRVLNAP